VNWSVVVLEDTVVFRKMPSNYWPQVVFKYVNIPFSSSGVD